jgi:hypothetical protein
VVIGVEGVVGEDAGVRVDRHGERHYNKCPRREQRDGPAAPLCYDSRT